MHHRDTSGLAREAHTGQKSGCRHTVLYLVALVTIVGTLIVSGCVDDDETTAPTVTIPTTPVVPSRLVTPSRSTSIALTSDDRFVVVANRETNSVAVIEVRNAQGQDLVPANKLVEFGVGQEPRYVAISPDDREIYVSNTMSGTVAVIPTTGSDAGKVTPIPVGTEPRAIAVTPNGTRLYVANHTDGTVSVIDVASRQVTATVQVGGNPAAIAITNNGDGDDTDETVFVTQFYAELIPNGPGEGRDLGKQGVVRAFSVANPTNVAKITLSPLTDSGFTADRTNFCPQSRVGGGGRAASEHAVLS